MIISDVLRDLRVRKTLSKKDYQDMVKANETLKAKGIRQQMKRALTEYYKVLAKKREEV